MDNNALLENFATMDNSSAARISAELRTAPGRNQSRAVYLTKEGDKKWNDTVVPALQTAFEGIKQAGLAYPFGLGETGRGHDFETIRGFSMQMGHACPPGLDAVGYSSGINDIMSFCAWSAIGLKGAAMGFLSDAFCCERSALLTREPQVNGVVTEEILRNGLEKDVLPKLQKVCEYYEVKFPEKPIESYQAGVSAGAVITLFAELRAEPIRQQLLREMMQRRAKLPPPSPGG